MTLTKPHQKEDSCSPATRHHTRKNILGITIPLQHSRWPSPTKAHLYWQTKTQLAWQQNFQQLLSCIEIVSSKKTILNGSPFHMKHTELQKNSIDASTSRLRSTMSKKFEKDKTEPFPIPTETRAQHKKKTRRTTIWYHCSVYSSTFDVECLLRVLWRMHKRKMESPVQKKKGTRFHNTSPPRARVPTLEVAAPILSWERLGVLHLVE